MTGFFDNVPDRYVPELRAAILAVHETKALLHQVRERFGTSDPEVLAASMGRSFDGVEVTAHAVQELEALLRAHEERRRACRELLARIAGAPEADPDASAPPAEEGGDGP